MYKSLYVLTIVYNSLALIKICFHGTTLNEFQKKDFSLVQLLIFSLNAIKEALIFKQQGISSKFFGAKEEEGLSVPK